MEPLQQWGVDLVITIQQIHGPLLDGIFRAITFMGEEEFYLLLLPIFFWCVDSRLGARVTILLLLSSYLNVGLKDLFQQPRPFDLEPGVKLSDAEGYGLPSNHSQSAVVVWGGIADWARKTWLWVVAIMLMVLMGFSRIYLGVHFPTDVLAGWVIGAILLIIYLVIQPRIEKRLVRLNLGLQILLAFGVPLVLLLIHPVKNTIAAMATLAGVGIGLALMKRYVSFNPRGHWQQRTVRFFIGGAVIVGLYLGLRAILPSEESALYLVFRFLHYWLIGLWVTLGAPWLFRLLKLSSTPETLSENIKPR